MMIKKIISESEELITKLSFLDFSYFTFDSEDRAKHYRWWYYEPYGVCVCVCVCVCVWIKSSEGVYKK